MGEPAEDRLLKVSEVAEIFRVDPRTVTRWARAGLIDSIRPHPRGQRRYRESQVRNLLAGKDN